MRQVCLQAIRHIEGQTPEVVQARDRSLQDEPWFSQEHQGSQGRTWAEDVKGAVGVREGGKVSEAEEAGRLRSGFIEVRRWEERRNLSRKKS